MTGAKDRLLPANDRLLPLNIAIGERFAGKYVVTDFLGAGGMSVVVAARHEQLGQTMAVKFFSVQSGSARNAIYRFFREARAAASLRSEHIVRVTDAGTDEAGRPFIAMEHLVGENLAALLRREGPLPIDRAVGYVLQTCEGIAEAHAAGIVHRDLKPENLFVTQRIDGSPLIKVLDFGIVKVLAPDVTTQGQALSQPDALMGTPLYMAPEQLRTPDSIDARTDVWAIGLILYELLAGHNPFAAATTPETFSRILSDDEVPSPMSARAEVPAALADIVLGCLRREMSRRTASVGLLAQALLPWAPAWATDAGGRAARLSVAAQGSAPPDHTPAAEMTPAATPRHRTRIVVGLAASLVAIAAAGTAWSVAGRRNATGPAGPPREPSAAPSRAVALPVPPAAVRPTEVMPATSSPAVAPAVQASRARSRRPDALAGTQVARRRVQKGKTPPVGRRPLGPGLPPSSGVDPLEGRE